MGLARIRSGGKDVLASGTVISFDMNPVEIELPDVNFKLVLEFYDEEGKLDVRSEGSMVDEHTAKLKLFNFKNPLGTGNTVPIQIGSIGDKKFYVALMIYSVSKTNKTIHYTFYLGGA
jgi:hypothetical protein